MVDTYRYVLNMPGFFRLQDGIAVPALGPLVISNSARVFTNSDALFEHSTSGYDRLCVRLELVTEQNSGTTSLQMWNRSR